MIWQSDESNQLCNYTFHHSKTPWHMMTQYHLSRFTDCYEWDGADCYSQSDVPTSKLPIHVSWACTIKNWLNLQWNTMQVTKGTSHMCERWATGGINNEAKVYIFWTRPISCLGVYRSKINCPRGLENSLFRGEVCLINGIAPFRVNPE